MAGIGERMQGNMLIWRDGKPFNEDGSPVDPEVMQRLEKRAAAWRRWEAGEDVSTDELFGDDDPESK